MRFPFQPIILWGSCCLYLSAEAEKTLNQRRVEQTIINSFVTRRLEFQDHPHEICRRTVEATQNGKEKRDIALGIPYSFSLSNVVSPLTGLGQLIVNPSPYINPLPTVLTDTPLPHLNRISVQQPLPLNPITTPLPPKNLITSGYFPDWNLEVLSPENVQYKKYDIINFAFGVPNANFGIDFTQSDSLQTLDKLVKYAHGNGTKVVLSIGGWSGSKFFSSAVRVNANRQIFANNICQLIRTHQLDGIDIDWEYPGQAEIQDNIVSKGDTTALLHFFKLLRHNLGSTKIISAAVTDYTFLNSNGDRMTDVTAFGQVLDYILIMNYDVWGASSNPGSNAPFSNACQDSSQPGANMISAIKTWTAAGFPSRKIIMGLAAYGYINHASTTKLVHKRRSDILQGRPRFDEYLIQAKRRILKRQAICDNSTGTCTTSISSNASSSLNDTQPTSLNRNEVIPSSDNNQTISPSTNQTRIALDNVIPSSNQNVTSSDNSNQTSSLLRSALDKNWAIGNGDLSSYSGNQIQFADLFKWGVLKLNGSDMNGSLVGMNGYRVAWDACSSTPYVYNKSRNMLVTFDDAVSIGIKASYAFAAGIGGVGFWEMTGDFQTILVDSARKNMGDQN